jgi:hypothetical protein
LSNWAYAGVHSYSRPYAKMPLTWED